MRRCSRIVLSLLTMGALSVPSAALAGSGPADAAGWERTASFLRHPVILDDTLRAEAASDGRAMVTFTRTAIEAYCGRSKTRMLGLEGRWRHRSTVKVVIDNQVQLVAGERLAWLAERCSGDVELHYLNRQAWHTPEVLDGDQSGPLRAGMNSAGLAALARPTADAIEVFTARPGDGWSEVAPLSTDGAAATVDHVAVTDSGQTVVVWHIGLFMHVATLNGDDWSTTDVPGDFSIDRVVVGSDPDGSVLIARAVDEGLYVNFRSPDGTVTEPDHIADHLAYGCTYVCMAIEVLPGGDSYVGWSADGLNLGRRDGEAGTWTTEQVSDVFGALNVRMDAHADGGVVLVDGNRQTVDTCSWTSPCSAVDYPQGTDHGMFAAAPDGAVVGISGRSFCDDWCDFDRLDGWERRP